MPLIDVPMPAFGPTVGTCVLRTRPARMRQCSSPSAPHLSPSAPHCSQMLCQERVVRAARVPAIAGFGLTLPLERTSVLHLWVPPRLLPSLPIGTLRILHCLATPALHSSRALSLLCSETFTLEAGQAQTIKHEGPETPWESGWRGATAPAGALPPPSPPPAGTGASPATPPASPPPPSPAPPAPAFPPPPPPSPALPPASPSPSPASPAPSSPAASPSPPASPPAGSGGGSGKFGAVQREQLHGRSCHARPSDTGMLPCC